MHLIKKKNTQSKLFSLLLLLSIPIFSGLINNTVHIVGLNEQNSITLSEFPINNFWYDDNTIDLKVSIPDLIITDSFIHAGQKFQRITIGDGGNLAEVGNPRIPFKAVKILLPHGKDVEKINVIKGKAKLLEGKFNIEPAQKQVPIGVFEEPEFIFNKKIYQSEQLFPEKSFEIIGIFAFRGYKILVLNLFPVSYIPKTGEISYVNDMIVQLDLKNEANSNLYYRGLPKDEAHLIELVDNPSITDTYKGITPFNKEANSPLSLSPGSYDYVIITDQNLKNSGGVYTFQDLAAIKNASGIQTRIITTDYIYANYLGVDNQEKIRNFIIDAYQNWGIEYVLLGGDGDAVFLGGESGNNIIPSRGFYATAYGEIDYNITSDLYYAALDGNWNTDGDNMWGEPGEDDLYAEVYVGRAPVDSEEELSNFIYKTLTHEAETHQYLSKALMVGEDLGWFVWGADYKDEVKDGSNSNEYLTVGFPNSFFVDILYDRELNPDRWNKSDLIPLINEGIHIINHLGHCDVEYAMKMVNDDVDSLSNTHYFFGYSQGCYNGAFDNKGPWGASHENDSIVEHFITTQHGAFAFVGNSRFGWGDPYGTNGASQYYDRQFYDAIFKEGIEEIGRANQDSKEDNIGYISQEAMRWCYYELNLFGDPTAKLQPQPNDFKPELTQGEVSPTSGDQTTLFTFSVNFTDTDDNAPIYVNVLINGSIFPMEKQNQNDNNYANGCIFQKSLYLQPGIYNYSFECADYKSINYTETYFGLTVSEKLNENIPSLNIRQVNPSIGFVNLTSFAFTVNYTDSDNNAPSYIRATINSTVYDMNKQDSYDSNYMDGCIYTYETILKEIGTYNYYFNCSDGKFLTSNGPYSGPMVKSCQLFDGMYSSYIYSSSEVTFKSNFTYSFDSGTMFKVNWDILPYQGSWKENALTRTMSDSQGFVYFGDGYHTPVWIFTNISIGDTVSIAVLGDGDHIFNISDSKTYLLSGFGETEVWVLEDLTEPGGYAWYEKSTGILLNGTFYYYNGTYKYTFDFVDTNVKFTYTTNDYNPSLTMGEVSPNLGDQTTHLNFSVIYTDLDNNSPICINVLINETPYPMEKLYSSDNNYIDGCIYQYMTYLQPGIYEYWFECSDWLFSNTTQVYTDLIVKEKTNDNLPTLTDGNVDPNIGYKDATLFTFSINYTDLDNNIPSYINVIINETTYAMYKQDSFDNNYMNGCLYIFSIIFTNEGDYDYHFNSSDGFNEISLGPYSGPIVKSCQLFSGLFINYLYISGGYCYASNFTYSYYSEDLFNVNLDVYIYQGSWKENVTTRIMSDSQGNAYFGDGDHTPVWIFTNVSLGDTVSISVGGEGDHIFNISDSKTYLLSGFGEIEIWVLEDLTEPGGYAWYEKSTGILLNGTFYYYNGSYYYTFEFIDTNVKFSYIEIDSITVTNPNSSCSWETGTSQYIYWISTGNFSNVKIELYKSGIFEMEITSSTPNDGTFYWTVPLGLDNSTQYQIKIINIFNSSIYNFSDFFEIYTISDSLTVIIPNNSISWETGTSQYIYWTSTGIISDIKIELYKDDAFVMEITSDTSNDGEYYWTILSTLDTSTQYQIKISDASDPSIYAFSDYFEIKSPISAPSAIPGYNLMILIGIIFTLFIIIVKNQLKSNMEIEKKAD